MGELWKDSMILYDRETWTRWSQMTGEATAGPLHGKKLRPIPSVLTDWEGWRLEHPDGTVLVVPHTERQFDRRFYDPLKGFVLGIAEGDKSKAWSFDDLSQTPAVNDEWQGQPVVALFDRVRVTARLYRRILASRLLRFRSAGDKIVDEQTGSTWQLVTGRAIAGPLTGQQLQPLPAMVSYRKAWLKFHPDSK
jgi:hypothetical protein